jgi:hypothetical protein
VLRRFAQATKENDMPAQGGKRVHGFRLEVMHGNGHVTGQVFSDGDTLRLLLEIGLYRNFFLYNCSRKRRFFAHEPVLAVF